METFGFKKKNQVRDRRGEGRGSERRGTDRPQSKKRNIEEQERTALLASLDQARKWNQGRG